MKIRLAKKIMKCKGNVSRWYWAFRLARYCELEKAQYSNSYKKNENPTFTRVLFCDHRITKAINLTSKISTIVDTSKNNKHERNN